MMPPIGVPAPRTWPTQPAQGEAKFNPHDLVAGMTLYLAHLLHRIEALQAEIARLEEDRR